MNWSKLPIPFGKVSDVVNTGLKALGKRSSVIPGLVNNIFVFAGKRILSRKGNLK
ncbi:MAG: hypothetical protein IH819_03340, partial [Bacteroidetes bacterium]|nr:hypothetical protein [Bacteroidota bacterium]